MTRSILDSCAICIVKSASLSASAALSARWSRYHPHRRYLMLRRSRRVKKSVRGYRVKMSYLNDLDPTPDDYDAAPKAEPDWAALEPLDRVLLVAFAVIVVILIVVI